MHPFQNRLAVSLAIGLATASAVSCLAAVVDPGRLTALATLVRDPAPRVRLEALRALAKMPSARSAELALSVLDQPMDPTLDYALWLTLNDLSEPWIAALQSGAWSATGHEKQLEFGLKAIKPEQASRVLGQLLAKNPLGRDGTGPWIELIGSAGTDKELRALFDQVATGGFDDAASARALRSLTDAMRLRKLKPGGSTAALATVLDNPSDAVRVEALKLAAVWKDLGPAFGKLAAIAGAPGSSPVVRSAAIEALRSIGGKGAIDALAAIAAPGQDAVARRAAVAALAALDLGKAVPAAVDLTRSLSDETQAQEFWRALLRVKGAGKAVAEALPATGVAPAAARAGMRVAREGGRNDMDLVLALGKASGLAADTQAFTGQIIKELAAKAADKGDPARGEMVYRRAELACISCHAIGGVGGKVGPDMTSIGASAPIDYLVESVLLPNAKIKEGFHALVVTTKDGTESTGTLARETPQEVVLRNAAGAEQAIPKTDIAKREQGTLSLMPGGLLDPLGEQDQLDLFAFLGRLGKPGDFDASQGGVARRWQLAQTFHTDGQAGQDLWPVTARADDKRWQPTTALVKGTLTRALIGQALRAEGWSSRLGVFAATEVTVARAGKIRFQLAAGPGAELWVGGRRVGSEGESTTVLPVGTHRIVVKLDPKQMPGSVRLTSDDVAFVLN